jgi:ATP-binding cassette, subfamily B, bacterial
VSFTYDDQEPVLRGIDLDVEPGRTVAIVGPTGSGKTTLVMLIPRLYDVTEGAVLVDGVDVRDVDPASLRREVAVVSDDAFLFSASLGENIAYARPDASEQQIVDAAERAGLAELLEELPDGLDTVVGERGLTLSGGQRQRVALARALVADPPFLVLDDVLASVDAAKEWEITRALRGAASGRTTLLMTHRLKAAAEADGIVVLDEGRVVEQGRHADLLAAGGLYARLWRVQQLEDELANA